MRDFKSIEKEINELKIGADEGLTDMLTSLHCQLIASTNAHYDYDELKEMILWDDDVLACGAVARDSLLWGDIRELQRDIVDLNKGKQGDPQ